LQTEKAYPYWVCFFIRWHGRGGVIRHPRDMGTAEVEAFLNMLANERQISPSTHNQGLSALLFLYREVMAVDLPWLNGLNRPAQKRRIPSVLTRKEVDFDQRVVVVRDGKGGKDRVVLLPQSLALALALALKAQLLQARAVWDADARAQRGGVETPHALEKKYPKAGHTWGWLWLFLSPTLSLDPRSGVQRSLHVQAVTVAFRIPRWALRRKATSWRGAPYAGL
jgi:integrase